MRLVDRIVLWPAHDFDDEIAATKKHQPAPIGMRTIERHVEPKPGAIERGGAFGIGGCDHHVIQRGDRCNCRPHRQRALAGEFEEEQPDAARRFGCSCALPGQGGARRHVAAFGVSDRFGFQHQPIEPAVHLDDVAGSKAKARQPLALLGNDVTNALGGRAVAVGRHGFQRHVIEGEQDAVGAVADMAPPSRSRSVTCTLIILIPGFWLDASSWDEVAAPLRGAGHDVRALTLPGMASMDDDRSAVGLRDHVDAVVAAVDEAEGPVVLVGHSGGGAIAHAVVDARPERVARVVYVDSLPLADGEAINDQLPVLDGEIPLPEWSVFGEEDLVDLDDELLEAFRARAIPEPQGVASDPQVLVDERRYDVPITVVACEYSSAQLQEWIEEDEPYVAELAEMRDVEYVDLPTGHWPQFTRPMHLAAAIHAAVEAG